MLNGVVNKLVEDAKLVNGFSTKSLSGGQRSDRRQTWVTDKDLPCPPKN